MTKLLAMSDTHLGPGRASRLTDLIPRELADADAILHAGDVVDGSLLDVLAAYAPVHAVLGNNDHGLSLPERQIVEVDGCTIALVHDSGAAAGRAARLRRWFPDADVVVFGHSHLPWHETDVRAGDGHVQHHLNPGSALQRRRAPYRTVAWITIDNGSVTSIDHVPVASARCTDQPVTALRHVRASSRMATATPTTPGKLTP
jgi:putative phosphoesterase